MINLFLKLCQQLQSSTILFAKGPMLCLAFFKALKIESQGLRQEQLNEVGSMINKDVGWGVSGGYRVVTPLTSLF